VTIGQNIFLFHWLIKSHCWLIQDEETQVCGVVLIENMADVGLVHAWNFDYKAIKLWMSVIQVAVTVFVM